MFSTVLATWVFRLCVVTATAIRAVDWSAGVYGTPSITTLGKIIQSPQRRGDRGLPRSPSNYLVQLAAVPFVYFTKASVEPRTQPKVTSIRIAIWLVCHVETGGSQSIRLAVSETSKRTWPPVTMRS